MEEKYVIEFNPIMFKQNKGTILLNRICFTKLLN